MATENVITVANLSSDFVIDPVLQQIRVSPPTFEVFGAGTQNVETTHTILALNSVATPHPDWAVADGVVTYSGLATRIYAISFKGCADAVANTRSVVRFALFHNLGEVIRSRGFSYNRTSVDGEDDGVSRVSILTAPGDTFSVRSIDQTAGDNTLVKLNESNMLFEAR